MRQKRLSSLPDALHDGGILGKALEDVADGANLLGTAVAGGFLHVLDLLVEAEGIVLEEGFEAGALDDGCGHRDQRIPQSLDFSVLRVVELTGAVAIGTAVTQLFGSLEGDFEMAFATGVEELVVVRDLKYAVGKSGADLNILVDAGGLDELRILVGRSAAHGVKVPAAVGAKLEGPLGRVEAGIGEV